MRTSILSLIAVLALVAGCSSSHRPTYSGHQESTEGVPGFVDGKKVSKHVKLGQSYTVDGETYVPRHEPDYVEEGKASWYGPGFHGGKTANGERFDANALTAAHRTLPLPSIVRVTMLSTGKQVYVRINDRGPFAHSRIIDLSRAAAEKIGLLRAGVAKVRVEYMAEESKRFADLLAEGREPDSIDVASEVLNYRPNNTPTQYARGDVRIPSPEPDASMAVAQNENEQGSFWDNFDPVADANANPARNAYATNDSAPVSDVVSNDLPNSRQTVASAKAPDAPIKPAEPSQERDNSPFSLLESSPSTPRKVEVAALTPSAAGSSQPAGTAGELLYVQFGAFQNPDNAERLRKKFMNLSELKVVQKPNSSGETFYHVRMGPYETQEATAKALAQAQQLGAEARIIREQ
jgi:rare lipoprotein A